MSYTALYRKFRPGEFDEVKGQDHIVTTLKSSNMISKIVEIISKENIDIQNILVKNLH